MERLKLEMQEEDEELHLEGDGVGSDSDPPDSPFTNSPPVPNSAVEFENEPLYREHQTSDAFLGEEEETSARRRKGRKRNNRDVPQLDNFEDKSSVTPIEGVSQLASLEDAPSAEKPSKRDKRRMKQQAKLQISNDDPTVVF